jgi:ABC-type phosphate transport system ATPase subunit
MKKIKTNIKTSKLQLERQIVRSLETHELVDIVGGTLTSAPTGVSGGPRVCCA